MADTYSLMSVFTGNIGSLNIDPPTCSQRPVLSSEQRGNCLEPATGEPPFHADNSPPQFLSSAADVAPATVDVATTTAELAMLLLNLNKHIPQHLLSAEGQESFESISSLASSLCELILIFERPAMHCKDASAPCLLLAVSVVGSVVNTYYAMMEGLDSHKASHTNLHKTLQLLADVRTMEVQLIYMRRLCHQWHKEFSTFQLIPRINMILAIIKRFTKKVKI